MGKQKPTKSQPVEGNDPQPEKPKSNDTKSASPNPKGASKAKPRSNDALPVTAQSADDSPTTQRQQADPLAQLNDSESGKPNSADAARTEHQSPNASPTETLQAPRQQVEPISTKFLSANVLLSPPFSQTSPTNLPTERRSAIGLFLLGLGMVVTCFAIAVQQYYNMPHRFKHELRGFLENPFFCLILLMIGSAFMLVQLPAALGRVKCVFEALLVAALVGFLVEIPHFARLYGPPDGTMDIVGTWDYQVSNISGDVLHSGYATIESKKEGLTIWGMRTRSRDKDKKELVDIRGGNYWNSHMVWFKSDGTAPLHWFYSIRLMENGKEVERKGYCELTPIGDPIEELVGKIAFIAPGDLTGNITFTRKTKRSNH